MGTRAVYSFHETGSAGEVGEVHNVYKHWDGYPTGGLGFIKAALERSWPLPRYEAAEFGAAFIAANKQGGKKAERQGGDVDLLKHGDWKEASPLNIEYHYDILGLMPGSTDQLHVKVWDVNCKEWDRPMPLWDEKLIFDGGLDAAITWAEKWAASQP